MSQPSVTQSKVIDVMLFAVSEIIERADVRHLGGDLESAYLVTKSDLRSPDAGSHATAIDNLLREKFGSTISNRSSLDIAIAICDAGYRIR